MFCYFRFYRKFEFPGTIGCIDCTHVAIVPPAANNNVHPEHIYINRKGYHSINTQLVTINFILHIIYFTHYILFYIGYFII